MGIEDVSLINIESEADVKVVYALMKQLRPHLVTEEEFLTRWKRQSMDGYRLVAAYQDGQAQALAGYRIQENLVYGRFLYVDDLITDCAARRQGYGQKLLVHLRCQARLLGCLRLVLDTPMSNSLAHSFYFRCGLLATCLRFTAEV